jgi:hypothetical protein
MSALLRLISILCTLVLFASFAMFVSDQAGSSSKKTVAQIAANDDTSTSVAQQRPVAEKKHGSVRQTIDDASDKLVSPFTGFVGSSTGWSRHIALLVIGLLVYGLGIGFVARYAATRGV